MKSTHVAGDHQGKSLAEVTDVIKQTKNPGQSILNTYAQVAVFELELVEPGGVADEPDMNMLVHADVRSERWTGTTVEPRPVAFASTVRVTVVQPGITAGQGEC